MIRKSDWQAVQDGMIAEDRRILGEPPTAAEMLAYSRGELGPEEEARVRALLVAYPELALALTAPFPDEDAEDVSQEEVSRRWESFQAQVHPEGKGGKVLQFWRASAALAAMLALVFGGLLWRESRREPQVLGDARELVGGQRGGTSRPVTLDAAGTSTVLIVRLYDAGAFERYRLELVDAKDRVLWRSGLLAHPDDDAFRLHVPRAYLDAGDYRIVLYGVDGTREQRLDTYSIRVVASRESL